MKIAVTNYSGNVGKTTITRHLLMPRIPGAEQIAIESINADEGQGQALRGRQFSELQEYLQTVDDVIVDVGASNIEELITRMRRYRGSHEDFDFYIVPTVPAPKQQQDTIATLAELAQLGVPPDRVRLVFNMVEDEVALPHAFDTLLAFLAQNPIANFDLNCRVGVNEIFGRIKVAGGDLAALVSDGTDYKGLIARAADTREKLALARKLATQRLATGVLPELDACFAALKLYGAGTPSARATPRKAA